MMQSRKSFRWGAPFRCFGIYGPMFAFVHLNDPFLGSAFDHQPERHPIKSMIKRLISVLTMIFLMVASCQRDFSPLSPEIVVRPAADLSQLSLAPIDSAYAFHRMSTPSVWDWDDNYVIKFSYQWRKQPDRFINIEQTITESFAMAVEFLRHQWENSSIYLGTPRPEDHPPIAGTISYQNGHCFIRDNIIIHCGIRNDSSVQDANVIKLVDELLLQSPTYRHSSALRPVIRKFAISKNPVPLRTDTPLIIDVVNPSGCGVVYYTWRFNPSFGGVLQEVDRYYFQSYMDDPMTIYLRLIAFNTCGFSSWAEIKIDVR